MDSQGLLLRRSKTKPKVTIVTGIKIRKMELGEKLEVTNSKGMEECAAHPECHE